MPGLSYTKTFTFALLLLFTAACSGPAVRRDLPTTSSPPRHQATLTPTWLGMKDRGWKRLDAIETWLNSSAAVHSKWRNYARLELTQGWIAAPAGSRSTSAFREARIATMLQSVMNDPAATQAQRSRAQNLMTRKPPPAKAGLPTGVEARAEWGARPERVNIDPVGGSWEKITVHHSAEVGRHDFNGTRRQSREALRTIQAIHQDSRGWADIGYHFLIDGHGRVFEGRALKWQGAHAGDSAKNRRNIGICLLGNFEKEHPSSQARTALRDLLNELRLHHKISRRAIKLHSELKITDCPGKHLAEWVEVYRSGGV